MQPETDNLVQFPAEKPAAGVQWHGGGIWSKIRADDGRRVYYVRVFWKGKPKSEKAGTTLKQAQKLAGIRGTQVDNGTYVPPKERKAKERAAQRARMTFREFSDRFIEDHASGKKRPEWFRDMVKRPREHFGHLFVDELTPYHVQEYVSKIRRRKTKRAEQGGRAARHANKELGFLRTMLNVAVRWKLIPSSPAKEISKDREPHREGRYITDQERDKLVPAAEDGLREAIQFALLTGMRVGEISGLDWERVDLEARTARLDDTKNGKPRGVPLVDDAVQLLKALPTAQAAKGAVFVFQEGRLYGKGEKRVFERYGKAWERACKAAGIQGATFHATRHTFASNYVMRGGNLFDLCRICGWSDFKMVESRYGHLSPGYLAGSIGRMQGAAGAVSQVTV